VLGGGAGAKRGFGGCAPSGCAGGRVPEEGLVAMSPPPEAAVFCVMSKRVREYRNVKISFLSLDLLSLTFQNIFGPLGGDRPPTPPHGSATAGRCGDDGGRR